MTIAGVLRFEIWTIVGASAALVAYKLLTRQINTRGILGDGSSAVAAAHVQMLVITGYVAISYLQSVATAPQPWILPDVPTDQVALLGGSHAIHLAGKAAGLLNWFPFLRRN